MAYALSHLHSLVRGSVGGLTYFANQFHQICMRQRTAPVQPNTPYQLGIRTAFDLAEAHWASLTEEGRELWAAYAQTCIYPGPAGPYSVPGRQLFVGTIGLVLYTRGVFPGIIALDVNPPLEAGWYNPGDFHVVPYSGLSQGIGLELQTPAGPFSSIVTDSSIGFPPTRLRYKGPWISGRKHFQQLPPNAIHKINVNLPIGMLGRTVFSRSRVFTAELAENPSIPHRMAFPVILRHLVELPVPNNGNDKAKKKPKAKEKPA